MVEKIKITYSISNSTKYLTHVDDKLQDLKNLMESIDKQLNESQWTGESRDKCRYIHQTITLYYQKITPLCDELKIHVEKLQKDANDFCGHSENITMIQSI